MRFYPDNTPWWSRALYADRRPFLIARNRIIAAIRADFDAQDFVEVETPVLQHSPGNEAHLHAFATEWHRPEGGTLPYYLRTSPEFSAKKLLAAGEPRIFELARVFRDRERGATHHPEFTMLEWYRAKEPYEALMTDCARLMGIAARAGGVHVLSHRDRTCDPFATPERLTVMDAFRRHAGIHLSPFLAGPGTEPEAAPFARAAKAAGIRVAEDDTWADVFSRVLVEKVEPQLGNGVPTILCEYPTSEAALARPKPSDTRVAERFELYACGVELANAFGELTDPDEQRRRFEVEMDEKARLYGERYPIDEGFLTALAQMPPASGCALGLDRLVMLASGARKIEDVLWASVEIR
ncbi:elongation factor P--(R)-beta-lysine ligase [Azorhizobium oxalatiphilum]|uniref:Elongation factor P--(R)-beta-lysine ligase n=1 Tax=Azorhizobium oxalatiphilum TaxID=980631 RepID=A0A917BWP8_9HYPH|nr:EF-P lysine aminoacylase EpmA [Azorhizobium oxalatiphilum]GGF60847.1 elongation factor P--(R)-beta-lysine ligase [Azorhizobium oxalatiphilum]